MSDEFDIYGDADTGDVADAQGEAGPATATAAPNSAGDGLPGYPVDGYPDWRAGVSGPGRGLLGMARTSDLVARPGADAPATLQFVTDQAAGANPGTGPDFQTVSWRDTDPEAINYDLYTAKRDLGEAQLIGKMLGKGWYGQAAAGFALKHAPQLGLAGIAKFLGAVAGPEVGAVAGGVGDFMNEVDAPRLQNKINTLQARQRQLGRSAT